MAKQSGLGQAFYAGGYDLSGDVSAINKAASPRATLEKTGINSSAVERILTHGNGELEWTSHFNPAAAQEHAALSTLPTADVVTMWLLGTASGADVACLNGKQINYDPNRTANGDLMLGVQAESNSSPLEWAELLTDGGKSTHASATSDSVHLDNGAGTSNGVAAYLEFFSRASGTPTFLVEHSTNDSVWATLLTFDGTGGATPFGERKTASGTVNRYLRAATTGTFTTAVFSIAVRRGTAQDDKAY